MPNVVTLEEMQQSVLTTKIRGVSPFIQHKWSEKAVQMMKDKHAGVRVKNREIRDPEQEFRDAAYVCEDGRFGFPAGGIKACLIGAAHKDIGLEKTLLRKSLFILPDDPINNLIALETDDPLMREDIVRIGMGSTDLRYRPEFRNWSMVLNFEFDAQALTQNTILNLIQRAGFGVGLGEWRPEKGGEYGRFEVDTSFSTVIMPKTQFVEERKAA
jgi:hypothetical protein